MNYTILGHLKKPKKMRKLYQFIILLFLPIMVNAQTDINQLYKDALKDYEDKNYTAYQKKMEKLNELLPLRPFIIKKLAGAYALNGHKKSAYKMLKKLIWLQADTTIQSIDDFAQLKNQNKFQRIMKAMSKMNEPINESALGFRLKDKYLHPEGLAYDPATANFYCSSIYKRKIIQIDRRGRITNFVKEGQDSLMAASGMRVDPKNRVLWVCTGTIPNMKGYNKDTQAKTGIFKYDIEIRRIIKKYWLPDDGKPHYLGDLSLNPITQNVYTTDSYSSTIYWINPKTDKLEPFHSHKDWKSLQGIDFSEDGKYLYVADYRTHIYRVDLKTKETKKVIVPKNVYLAGVDGLYFYKNSLVAIHNGIQPFRVIEYLLKDDLLTVKKYDILEQATPVLEEPTLGVFYSGEFFYIANSPWGAYDRDGSPIKDKFKRGIVLKVRLWETGESLKRKKRK